MQRFLDALHVEKFGIADAVEILIVAFLLYKFLLLIRRTRAVQALVGISLLVFSYWAAELFQFSLLRWILSQVMIILPVAMIVIFQNTIRRAFANFGRNPFWHRWSGAQADTLIEEIVLTATALASQRTGGLIVVEREEGLRNWIESGVLLDSFVRFDLLVSIFNTKSPLHDGAVIIQDARIKAAACMLPLTSNPRYSREHGSRHRAAIGITEETDAVVVVISEERGTISWAEDGELERFLDAGDLRERLARALDRGDAGAGAAPAAGRAPTGSPA